MPFEKTHTVCDIWNANSRQKKNLSTSILCVTSINSICLTEITRVRLAVLSTVILVAGPYANLERKIVYFVVNVQIEIYSNFQWMPQINYRIFFVAKFDGCSRMFCRVLGRLNAVICIISFLTGMQFSFSQEPHFRHKRSKLSVIRTLRERNTQRG